MIAAAAPMVAGMMSGHSGSGSHQRWELFLLFQQFNIQNKLLEIQFLSKMKKICNNFSVAERLEWLHKLHQ